MPERGSPIVEATHAFQFSAAHRLNNPRFGAAENARVYGRCNNPKGHGHTYRLEVTLRGPVSPDTGWVEGGQAIRAVVQAAILDRFDRANLDREITRQDGPASTTEVLAGLIWRLLDGSLPAGRLCRLRLEETPNNIFELDRGCGGPVRIPQRGIGSFAAADRDRKGVRHDRGPGQGPAEGNR